MPYYRSSSRKPAYGYKKAKYGIKRSSYAKKKNTDALTNYVTYKLNSGTVITSVANLSSF